MAHLPQDNRHTLAVGSGSLPRGGEALGCRGAFVRLNLPGPWRGIPDESEVCLRRVLPVISARPEITGIHILTRVGEPVRCLHYDPTRLVAARAARLARLAGAAVASQRRLAQFVRQAFAAEAATRQLPW
jgi:hypothetical protein